MFCPKCGTPNDDDAFKCVSCGNVLQGPPAEPTEQVPNYLVWAILCTICCCVPLGIVAIVYAAQVNSKIAAGDVSGARDASDKAKIWCIVAFVSGLVVALLSVALQVAVGMMGAGF